jgi:hypothetical protein
MAFKRYIKIKGKNYGPYYYKSYRENGKVINKYISKEIEPASDVNSAYKPQKYGILAFLVLALFCIGLIWLLGNLKSVGHAGLNIETEYVPGENLIGSINFNLKEGELIPANSMLILELGNNSIEVPISEVLDNSKVSGDFFAEGVSLSGSGEGYGIAGSKIIYPKVDFELLVSADSGSVNEEQPIEQPETPEEEITDGRIAQGETTTDNGGEAINDDGIAQEETPTDNEESAGGEISGGGMTGMAICGDEFIVAGSASKGEDYVHTLEDGQSAEIASGSVKVDGQEIGDCEINLDVSGNEARVSTEYSISEEGFGEDYLGEEMLSLSVDISKLNLKAEEGEFNVRLVYDNSVIAEVSEDISVLGTEIPASNLSLIKDIPAIRIQKNGNFSLDLSEYFAGAERYALEVSDIGAEFDGRVITLIPNEDFKGSRKGKIIAYAGASSLESNEFNILVSSGAVNIDISRGDIKVGERVRWVQNVSLELPEDITIELPKEARDVIVKKIENEKAEEIDSSAIEITGSVIYSKPAKESATRVGMTGLAIGEENNLTGEKGIEVLLDENATEYFVEYYTEAPQAFEEETGFGKRVVISGPDELNYTDVLSFANISETLDVGQESKIKIHWVENDSYVGFDAYDIDGNGKLDYVEWITPHLSNQTFDIILIIAAQHLDENRTFISDIFDYVNEQDDNWSEPIYSNQYVRATFEQNLTNGNIINIYARNTQGLNSSIEVYEKDGSTLLASTPIIIPEQMYDIQLAGMNESSDAFDIKIANAENNAEAYLEFDYIKDAQSLANFNGSFFDGFESASLATNNWERSVGDYYWGISTNSPYAGTYDLLVDPRNVAGEIVWVNISTIGYNNIKFSFYAKTSGLDSGEYVKTDWDNGTGWTELMNVETIDSWTLYNYSLDVAANNNADFKIRFRCSASNTNEKCFIDNVNVSGSLISSDLIDINETVGNSAGTGLTTNLEIIDSNNASVYNDTKVSHGKRLAKGLYKIKIRPQNNLIKKISINDFDIEQNINQIIDIEDSSDNQGWDELYSVRPNLNLTGTNTTIDITIDSAKGNTLYKCKDWNFTTQTCYGTWQRYYDMIPGQSYTFTIFGEDPGFVETNESTNYLHDEADSQFAAYKSLINATTDTGAITSEGISLTTTGLKCWNANWTSHNWTSLTSVNGVWNFSIYGYCDHKNPVAYLYAKIFKLNATGRYNIASTTQSTTNLCDDTSAPGSIISWNYNLAAGSLTNLSIVERVGIQICANVTTSQSAKLGFIQWEDGVISNVQIPFKNWDSVSPQINYGLGTETSGTTLSSRNNILVNATASDTNLANITINLYNSTGLANTTTTLTSPLFLNFTNLVNGIYYFNATALDLSGNSNSTETRNVTINVDTTAPAVFDLRPIENSSYISLDVVEIAANVSDVSGISSVWANLILPNETIEQRTLSLAVGNKYNASYVIPDFLYNQFNITFFANDSVGNLNNTEKTYFRDDPPGTWLDSGLVCYPNPVNNGTNIICNITYTCTSQNCVRGPSGFYLQDDGIRINDKVCSTKDFICNNVTILASSTCANRVANGVTCRAGTNSAGCSVGQTLIAQYNFTACSGLEAPPSTNIINASFEDDGGSTDSATLDDSFVENITMPDNVPPLVTLNSPLNQTYNTTTINFNVSINENGTCKFSLDLAANISMSTTDNRNFNYVNSTMTQGSHNARYYCNDSAGNLNNTKSVVFGVDTIIPMIQFESLTETSGSILGRSNININVTASDSGGSLKNITIYLYNSTGLVNSTTTLTSPNFVNISNLANGIYYFNATAYDSAGNRNLTETRNVTIDTSAPLISIIRPQNLTYNNATQLVNISASDSIGISRIWFYNGTGNETYTTAVYRTFAEGSNTLYAWANDTSGNLNYTSVVFNIDTTAPSISIVSPASANYTNATILVNISISGANYTWFFNGTGNETYSGAVYRTFNQGSITVYAYANDSVGNLNYSSVMFFVDSIKPLIDFVSPTPINNSILSQNNIPVNISVNDTNLDKVVLRLYNSSALINTTISSSSNLFINFANLANGIYYINATANDTLGNENSTSTRKITLDTIKPSVAIVYPQNTSYGNSVEQLNYSVSDVNLQACWYSTDFGANNNSVTCGNNVTGLTSAEGSNTWIAWANDSAGNVNYSSVTFIVDLSAPGIYFVTPTENNEDYLNRKNIQVNITASNLQVANVTIRLYNATGFVNSSMTNETALEIHLYVNFSNLNDGVYYFNATAVDAFSRSNSTGTRNVTIDTIKPLISLVSPTDNSGISVNRNNIAINASANDTNLQSITISIYNLTSGLVYSYNSGNSSLFVNQSGLDDGIYYFNATALDLAGNSNSTETRNVTIETQAPLITINSPQNITYTTQIILFNVTLSENGTCLYSLDSSANRTMSSSNNRAYSAVNSTMTEGSHNVMFNCNDSVGNFNSTSVVFFVDSIYPLINYGDGTETSGTIMIRTNIVVNASASDGNFANLTINLHNSTGLVNSTTTLTTSLFLNFTNLVDGIYYFNATALDLAGNSNSTETRNVTIDTRAPVVVDLIPAANASFNPLETIEIGANVSNAHNIDSVFANVTLANGTTSLITLSNVFGVKYNNSFAIPGVEGRYNITFIANDSLGNLNDSETTYFVVRDSIVPSIYLFNPGSGVNYVSTSQNVVFQYNVSDFNIANCSLVVNNAVSNTSLSVNTSAGAINQFTNVFGAGSYSWNIRCADNNNNINSSAARSFSVTAPVVTPPSEGGGGGGGGGGAPTYLAPAPKEEAGKPAPISVNPEELSIMLVAGTGGEREITIRNLRNATISLSITVEGEVAKILNAPTGLSLGANEEKVVKLTISKAEKGLLTGKIVIRTGDYSKDVPVVINLKSENFLFDSALTIPEEYRAIKPGDDLVAQVNLLQVGPKEKVDVVATYVIKDLTGKKYLEETETFFVLEAKDYVKTFYTDNFPAGKYVLGLDIAYPGAFATSSAQFEILGTGIDKFSNQTIILILVLGVIGLGFLVWVLRARSLLYKGLVKRGINRKV